MPGLEAAPGDGLVEDLLLEPGQGDDGDLALHDFDEAIEGGAVRRIAVEFPVGDGGITHGKELGEFLAAEVSRLAPFPDFFSIHAALSQKNLRNSRFLLIRLRVANKLKPKFEKRKMNLITFHPEKHLSRADQERLSEMAREAGLSVADFIETVLKKALFAMPKPEPEEVTQ